METPFWVPPKPSAVPNSRILDSVHRQRQAAARRGERDRRGQPPGVVEGGNVRPALLGRARGEMGGAVGAVEVGLELADEVLEAVDLAGEVGGALAFAIERLLGV